MALNLNTLQSGTNGSALANPLATDGYAFTTAGLTYSAANSPFGKMCALTAADTTAGYFRATGLSITSCAARLYLMAVGTVPTTDFHVINILTGGTTRVASVHINAAGKLRVSDASGTTGVWTATNALVAGRIYRMEMSWATGSSSSTGTLAFDYYACGTLDAFADTTTPVQTGYSSTTANVGSGTAASDIYLGKRSNVAFQTAISAPAFADGQTTYLGRYLPTAASTVSPFSVRDNAGGWTLVGTGVNKIGALGDASDATYIVNPDTTTNEAITVDLPPLEAGSSIAGPVRMGLDTGSASTAYKIEILQDSTVVATRTGTATSETVADVTVTLTAGEVAAITDRTALRARITAKAA